jgi:hypothetical protein
LVLAIPIKICRENPNFFRIEQKYRALSLKTLERFISAGDINWSYKLYL